jgi:hypothetical protein
MLQIAHGGRRGRRTVDALAAAFRFSVCRVNVGVAESAPADLPSIALTDYNPCKVALVAARIWFIMSSITPSSDRTYVVADPI